MLSAFVNRGGRGLRLREIFAPRDHYSVAVLGPRFSGKTTLINYWRGLPPPDLHTGRTFGQEKPTEWVDLSIKVDNRRVTFDNVLDITGAVTALDLWADYIRSRHVVYMLDARALCGCLAWTDWYREPNGRTDPRGLERVTADIGQLLMHERHGVPTSSRAIVVSHTDQDCRRTGADSALSDQDYATVLSHEIRPFQSQLSSAAYVPVIVASGNLEHEAVARQVTTELVRHFEAT
jgi:hypothetical protein